MIVNNLRVPSIFLNHIKCLSSFSSKRYPKRIELLLPNYDQLSFRLNLMKRGYVKASVIDDRDGTFNVPK